MASASDTQSPATFVSTFVAGYLVGCLGHQVFRTRQVAVAEREQVDGNMNMESVCKEEAATEEGGGASSVSVVGTRAVGGEE